VARASEPGPSLFDTASEPAPLSVGQLARILKSRLAELGRVRVEGEISGLKPASSGHLYFALKDEQAALSCAIWKSTLERMSGRALDVKPAEGLRVVATGRLDLYEPRGTFSLIVEKLEPVGLGRLLLELERLKAELRALGWFERERPLPALPRCVGVVTSRDGAAWRDFLETRRKRWPDYPVRLCHTQVQGPGAAHSIAAAIGRLAESGVDVIALVRGGGSLEDLWAFNERPVAAAIWNCPVPVVSGVGHETDVTLADLVADLRAHTPTDAAQSVIPLRAAYDERLERAFAYLSEALHARLAAAEAAVQRLAGARVLRGPGWILGQRANELKERQRRLGFAFRAALERESARLARLCARVQAAGPRARLAPFEQRLLRVAGRLSQAHARTIEPRSVRLALVERGLAATSPLAVLGRGYSVTLVRGADGVHAVRAAAQLAPGAELTTLYASGSSLSRVLETRPSTDESAISPAQREAAS
jgi:exodeoxyribonuclease VII large subunit